MKYKQLAILSNYWLTVKARERVQRPLVPVNNKFMAPCAWDRSNYSIRSGNLTFNRDQDKEVGGSGLEMKRIAEEIRLTRTAYRSGNIYDGVARG